MTVKLLADRRIDGKDFLVGNLCDTDDATEAGLIAAKLAVADLTGGTAYVAPAVQPQYTPVFAQTNPLTGGNVFSYGASSVSFPAGLQTDQIKGIATTPGYMYFRYPWSATLDAVNMVRLYSANQTINGPVDFYGVRTIPIATPNTSASIGAAYTSGTVIAAQTDSIGPLQYNGTFIGANHGPFIGHSVACAGHGKVAVDVGSEWSGPAARKFYLLKIVDANTLWFVSDNSGTAAQWAFYATSLNGQTLTHSYGATNTGNVVITADTTGTQIAPFLNNRTLQVVADGIVIDHTSPTGIWTPKTLSVIEKYSIVSPVASIAYMRSKVGSNPKFNDDSIAADAAISNVHNFHINGCHTVDQTVTWNSAVNLTYFGTVQDVPPNNIGVMTQYMPGVGIINAVDYRAGVDISGTLTPWTAAAANWLDASNPPNRMAQIISVSSVNKYGIVLGYSPITGIATRSKRLLNVDIAGGQASAGTKKQYPRACSVTNQPTVGSSQRVVGYHHVYNAEQVPDATVATWFKDGDDYVVVLDFHKVSALSRVSLPAACDGFTARLVDSQNVSLLSDVVIDGGGVSVACSSTYGYAVIRVSAI